MCVLRFTFSYSLFTRTGSELVPSEGNVVGSMVGAGAAVEEGRHEVEPVAERIQPQPVREESARSTQSEALYYFASSPQSAILT